MERGHWYGSLAFVTPLASAHQSSSHVTIEAFADWMPTSHVGCWAMEEARPSGFGRCCCYPLVVSLFSNRRQHVHISPCGAQSCLNTTCLLLPHVPCNYAINTITLKALNYFCINHGGQTVYQYKIIINVLASSFCLI